MPTTAAEKRARETALNAMVQIEARFRKELDIAGATAWNAANAFSGWLQHDKGTRLKDSVKAADQKMASNLFGVNQDGTLLAMNLAMSL